MAIRSAERDPGLTRREWEVAALVAEGLTNRQIAERLFISERTADSHLEHLREKLAVSSRAQVATWFVGQASAAETSRARQDWIRWPPQPTVLLGRERELAEVRQLMLGPEIRLLTLTGPPGTGKTRLASRVALDLAGEFADGAHFVDLSPISDPSLVLSAIAQVVGARPSLESLAVALRHKQTLLLLDNFEQVLPAAGQMAELLAACPEVKLMVTSRECLHLLRWEHEYPVQPLQLPDLRRLPPLEELLAVPAVALFVERARARNPQLALSEGTGSTVAKICVRLDGLPLAIELAGAALKALPLDAIFSRLKVRQELLSQGGADFPTRHHSVSAAIDASYDLLSADEQSLFRRLGVFVGGFDLESMEAVCAGDGITADQATSLVTQLVDKSLVQLETGGGRYRLLETIREYALERLAASGEAKLITGRHTRYFVSLGEKDASPGLRRAPPAAYDRLQLEIDNLRATFATALVEGDLETGLRLGTALMRFWAARGFMSEGRETLAVFVKRADEAGMIQQFPAALRELAVHSIPHRDHPQAPAQLERYLRMARDAGDHQGAAIALNQLGSAKFDELDPVAARPLLEEALQEARLSQHEETVAVCLGSLGLLAHLEHDDTKAIELIEESSAIEREMREIFNSDVMHSGSMIRGLIAFDQADYKAAAECWAEVLRMCWAARYRFALPILLDSFVRLAIVKDTPANALRLAGAADIVYELTQVPRLPFWHEGIDPRLDVIAGGDAKGQPEWAAGRAMSAEDAVNLALSVAAQF